MTTSSPWTVGRLAAALGAAVVGDAAVTLTGIAMMDDMMPGAVTYAASPDYLAQAEASEAAAIIVGRAVQTSSKPLLQVDLPKVAFARALELFFPREVPAPGIHPSAVVAGDAEVDPTASLGPQVVIGPGARIGPGCVLHAGVHIGARGRLGAGCELFDHVVLYEDTRVGDRVRIHAHTTIGADGFGYVFDGTAHRKIPHVGTVEIADDVEIGAGACIDRGTLGATRIGTGARIDNLVQIGHNVQVGEHAVLIAQAGISGSTRIGNFAVLGGQAGVSDHLTIGDGAVLIASSKVMRSVPPGQVVFGLPGRPWDAVKRIHGALSRLPNALKRLRRLEKAVDALRETRDRRS